MHYITLLLTSFTLIFFPLHPRPNVRSFLSLAGYHRDFVKNSASLASLVTCLLKKYVPFCCHEAQQQSLNILKRAVTEAPVISFGDYKLPFTLCTNASVLGNGAVLVQTVEGNHPHVIAYASRAFAHAVSLLCYSYGSSCSCLGIFVTIFLGIQLHCSLIIQQCYNFLKEKKTAILIPTSSLTVALILFNGRSV